MSSLPLVSTRNSSVTAADSVIGKQKEAHSLMSTKQRSKHKQMVIKYECKCEKFFLWQMSLESVTPTVKTGLMLCW